MAWNSWWQRNAKLTVEVETLANGEKDLLSSASIPEEVRGYLRAVLDTSKLPEKKREEVLRELLAHFEDGFAAGKSVDDLLKEFGDRRLLGTLIRRSKDKPRWSPTYIRRILCSVIENTESIGRDLRLSARGLRRNPGYTSVAVLTLALGIGANTAVFSVLNAALFNPLKYHSAHELVLPVLTRPSENVWDGGVGYGDFLRWRDQREVFQNVGLWYEWNLNVSGGDRPERIKGALTSYRYFDLFDVAPALGRFFSSEEHDRGNGKVAILSTSLWERRFGGDPSVVGTTVYLDEEPYEVVGIVPPEAEWPRETEIWIPLTFGSTAPQEFVLERDYLGYSTIARLQPGVSIQQAEIVVDQIAKRAALERPDTRAGSGAALIPFRTSIVGVNTPRTLWLLMGCVGFVLLIACANVANLTLERSIGLRKEISIRAAIGAGRGRSVRPLVFECLLVALIGGSLGVAVALWGTEALGALAPASVLEVHDLSVDVRILLFGLAASLLTGIGFALAPVLLAGKLDLRQTLTEASARAGFGPRGNRIRSTMGVAQIALSVVLVLGASLAAKSTIGLVRTNPGFVGEGVLSMKVFLPHYAPGSPEDRMIGSTYQAFTERLEALPGVTSAAAVSGLPLSADGLFEDYPVWIEGVDDPSGRTNHFANWNIVGSEFFSAMTIPLVRGRLFNSSDGETDPRVAVLSESFASALFPNQNPIGQRIRSRPSITASSLEVVGVVGDVRYTDLTDAGRPVVYVPMSQVTWREMAMVVRFAGDPTGRVDEVREAIWAIAPSAPVTEVRTMTQLTSHALATPRFVTGLVAIFAILALLLAVIGVYGIINVSLRQRYHELGVRKALGAGAGQIGRLLVGQGARLALLGIVIGLPIGMAMTRTMSSLLFEVRTHDITVLIGVPLLLAVCALLAAALPARRASSIDPAEALRSE